MPNLANDTRTSVEQIERFYPRCVRAISFSSACARRRLAAMALFFISFPPGFARPAAHKTLVFCYRVVGAVEFVSC
jgi:hypothetical protein